MITGPSGSGKSSLAFDVLYAEGQRRYLESLSLYARQFLGIPQKSDCDRIEGLCPAIAIDQKTVGSNPRSTVGTITEVSDYLRVLFARCGHVFCPHCNVEVSACSIEQMTSLLGHRWPGLTVTITAPIAHLKKGTFVAELEALVAQGYHRFVVDGGQVMFNAAADIARLQLAKTERHSIDVMIDVVEILPHDRDEKQRLYEALERSTQLTGGAVKVIVGTEEFRFSTEQVCLTCGRSFPDLEPRMFSFNSPIGACARCHGLGILYETFGGSYHEITCQTCLGRRLNELALSVFVANKSIYELGKLTVKNLLRFFAETKLPPHEHAVAKGLIEEIVHRLEFLENVGLGYLSLNREARSLSGGEGQRIRLARQLGSALSGVLYLLDEPSIGLHQRDNDRLIDTLKRLRDLGNTVIVVEHDHDTMNQADYLIDMGPAAGIHGGEVVAVGSPDEIKRNPASVTGQYLSGKKSIQRIRPVRKPLGMLRLEHATANNLQDLTVDIPLGVLAAVSGVSGSGKSSLVMQELVPAVQAVLERKTRFSGTGTVSGGEQLASLVVIDQSPIGRTPRSNPATYVGIFDEIRNLFAGLPESKARGYTPGRFSFNRPGGRCETCSGEGILTVSMHFLPDVTMPCKACKGRRYNDQTLQITYKDKTIADVLAMNATEAVEFFGAHKNIAHRLKLLCDVGLGYLALGQPSTTLSGGEAQRIKLVNELAKRGTRTLYILDEPTTGLHATDIDRLLQVFDRLIEKGNSMLVIEHNLDVLKTADYLIDIGPEGGDEGGQIVAAGTPHEVAQVAASRTGRYLKAFV